MKKKIKVISDGQLLFGEIEVLNISNNKAYVMWRVFDSKRRLIASFTNDYFFDEKEFTEDDIFELVKNQMLKYRVGRKKIFSSVEF